MFEPKNIGHASLPILIESALREKAMFRVTNTVTQKGPDVSKSVKAGRKCNPPTLCSFAICRGYLKADDD